MVRNFNFTNVKGLHFSHINIRSLLNKFDIVKQTVVESDVPIVAFSESWLTSNIPNNMIEIPGYSCNRLDRSWLENGNIKKGGGVCCYIKSEICHSASDFNELNCSSKDIEICWITLNIPLCRRIVLGIVYRPPQGNVKKFCDTMDEHIENILDKSPISTDIFILGDCNINYFQKNTHDMRELKWFEQKNSLTQIISQTTRFSNNNSCIDLIFFTNSTYVADSGTLDVNLSDHEMIFVTRKHIKCQNTPTTFTGRSYMNFDVQNFENMLLELDWNEFFNNRDVNECWKLIKNNILTTINQICPEKTFKIKKLKDPWISQEILEGIKDKDLLLSRAKHSNNPEDWIAARNRRNEVKDIVKNAKSEFIKENLNEHKNDSKKFWKTMSNVLPSGKNKSCNKILLKDDLNNNIEDNFEAAEVMNKFFTSIGPKLASNLQEPWAYSGKIVENDMDDIQTNREEVLEFFKEININKSSAIPSLTSKVLKPACLALVDHFVYIYNLCLENNEFPREWKYTIVTPIPKMVTCRNVQTIGQFLCSHSQEKSLNI